MAGRRSGGLVIKARIQNSEVRIQKARCGRLIVFCILNSLFCTISAQPPPLKEFSHKKHLQLGNVAPVIANAIDKGTYLGKAGDIRSHLNGTNPCLACHRGMDESERVSSVNMPQMADCLVCHNKVDPPFSCEFCHPASAKLKPANHTADFLDTHTKKNAGLDFPSCAVCHGRKFTCLGCHQG